MSTNHRGVGLRRYLTCEFLTGNQRTEASHLAQHGAAFRPVSLNRTALDFRRGRPEVRNPNRRGRRQSKSHRPLDLVASLVFLELKPRYIHASQVCKRDAIELLILYR
jgi:hypothetical protein